MTQPNAEILAYIHTLPRNQQLYAARYAHWLDEQPNPLVARDHADQTPMSLTYLQRLRIRRAILKLKVGDTSALRMALAVGI